MTTHIQQRSGNDCVLTAIAMALGYERWEDCWTDEDLEAVKQSRGIADIEPWLERKGLARARDWIEIHTYGDSSHRVCDFLWRRRALVSINSLNEAHGGHMIYWDGYRVWDPQEGREGKLSLKYLRSAVIQRAVLLP